MESSRRGSKKDTGKYVAMSGQLCRYSCSILVYYISMQKFEVGEIYIVGRPTSFFFTTNCDFLSAVTTSRVTTTTILVLSGSFTFI